MKEVVSCILLVWGSVCFAGKKPQTFEGLFGIWFDRLLWSDENGFSAVLSKESPPGHVFFKGHVLDQLSFENGTIDFQMGKRYVLTNGDGRKQEVEFLDAAAANTNSLSRRMFGRELQTLIFQHWEYFRRARKWVPQTYVISAEGDVCGIDSAERLKIVFPYETPQRVPVVEERKHNVIVDGERTLIRAKEDCAKAKSWLLRHPECANQESVTNEVCYRKAQRLGVESYDLVLKKSGIDPALKEMVKSRLQQTDDNSDWALVCCNQGKRKIVSVCVGFGNGGYRTSWFLESGEVDFVLQGHSAIDQYMLRQYDGNGILLLYLDYAKGGINNFWIRENGDYVECKDEARAKMLIAEAMARSRQFKRGAK